MSTRDLRHARRRLRKAILAEALAVARAGGFGCREFTMDTATGQLLRVEPDRDFSMLSDLLHLCAQLEGRVPLAAA